MGPVEKFRLNGEAGGVVARLAVDSTEFRVVDDSPEDQNFSPETLSGGTVRLVLITEDPNTLIARAGITGRSGSGWLPDYSYATHNTGWRMK